MPIKKSAIKHLRQIKKITQRNNQAKKDLKQFVKEVRRAITARDKDKLTEYGKNLQKVIDKAAKRKVIKPNNAARRKSRLTRQMDAVLKS